MAATNRVKNVTISTAHSLGLSYDRDIGGLFKPEQVVTIIGKKVRFIAPSQIQRAMIMQFLILGLQDLVSTTAERQKLTKGQLFDRCMKKLTVTTTKDPTPAQQQEMLEVGVSIFANPAANEYFMQAVRHCFPDIPHPELLTDDALMAVGSALFDSFLQQQAADTKQS